jgi:hypothetical protein
MKIAVVSAAIALLIPLPAGAQVQGAFADASFDAAFRKFTPPRNDFSPYFSWDADMALDLTVFRRASNAVTFTSVFQAIGTENLGSKVGVGGTGYVLNLGYVHTYSPGFKVSAGIGHLSSHLTRDLDAKLLEKRNEGLPTPVVDDPSEYNVFFLKGHWTFSGRPLKPEIEIAIEPINFRLDGGRAGAVRPLYVATRATLWRDNEKSLVAATSHEIGKHPFNVFSLTLELFPRNQPEGRLQLFVRASPGHSLHVSPNLGGVRDGITLGIRLHFRA